MKKKSFAQIKEILRDAKKGKMFILVDENDRENEGDLIIPAEKITPENINFMAKFGRGLICLSLTKNRINDLELPLMNPINQNNDLTAFTVSSESAGEIIVIPGIVLKIPTSSIQQ